MNSNKGPILFRYNFRETRMFGPFSKTGEKIRIGLLIILLLPFSPLLSYSKTMMMAIDLMDTNRIGQTHIYRNSVSTKWNNNMFASFISSKSPKDSKALFWGLGGVSQANNKYFEIDFLFLNPNSLDLKVDVISTDDQPLPNRLNIKANSIWQKSTIKACSHFSGITEFSCLNDFPRIMK